LVDIGTGDGRFVLEQAKLRPDTLCIGVDASQDGLIDASSKARKKPSKGGAPNALFLLCAVEALPDDLVHFADEITINYPWGSLLSALVKPDSHVMKKVVRLAKPSARVSIVLNWSVLENHDYCDRLGLPRLTLDDMKTKVRAAYSEVGLIVEKYQVSEDEVATTTWGKRLVKGSNRKTLSLLCRTAR
jgi:16S rRNA (adenine(1408)-N(1))-methyltransferase